MSLVARGISQYKGKKENTLERKRSGNFIGGKQSFK
jgi:hypothetical protein